MDANVQDREIVFVVARARNGCIAKDGDVPWKIREDLQHFVRQTTGKAMVMGRKTFDSLPGLLPGRRHIVLTRQRGWSAPGAEVVHTVEDALALARGEHIAVIGGADIFALFEPFATRLEITEVHEDTEGCDVFMPAPERAVWREVQRDPRPATAKHPAYDFVSYLRLAEAPEEPA
jgi:dihydrofolate reductase